VAHLIPTKSYSKLPEAAQLPGFPHDKRNWREEQRMKCQSDIFQTKNFFFFANGVKKGK
jgi:hypothetical protein